MKYVNRLFVGGLAAAALVLSLGVPVGHVSLAAGAILYVDADATGANDGTSWENAFTDLQPALEAAVSGDQIWVAEGIYKPALVDENVSDRYRTFQMMNGVALYGGFDPTVGDETWEERDWEANQTILSGDLNGDDGPNFANYTENCYHVFYHSMEMTALDESAILDGFTITGGYANGSVDHAAGGGMFNYMSSPTITNVVFMLNYAQTGGGMFNHASSPVLTGTTFLASSASLGGGMANNYSSPGLTGVYFIGNNATQLGAGMYNYWSSPSLTNVVFSVNRAGSQGGGMYNDFLSQPTLTNVTFADNFSARGAGMLNFTSNPIITNAIFWGSWAFEGQIVNLSSTLVISYSDMMGGCPPDAVCDHVINLEPQFIRDPSAGMDGIWGNSDDDYGDLRLQLTSPAIDAGDNTAVPAGVVIDLDGNPRFVDIFTVPDTGNGTAPIVDMGAYETYTETIAPTVVSILRADPNPTHADSVNFVVTFSEDVGGVDVSDFSLFTTGSLSGSNVTDVSGTGSTYTVAVAVGSGIGSLRLDVPDTASITDMVGNPLSGLPYQSGEVYTILLQIYLPAIAKHTP